MHFSFLVMSVEPRRSRRLRGMAPEEAPIQQVCFICQRDIDIGSLTQCHYTPCCHVFMHRRCYQEMGRQVRTCGNCRRVIEDNQPEIVLETDEELEDYDIDPFVLPSGANGLVRFSQELTRYRSEDRPMRCHHEGSYMWDELPYGVDPDIWQRYYVMLENFVTLFTNEIMHMHGCVRLPVEPTREIRNVLYRLFIFNTPYSAFNLIRILRFRLFFRRVEGLSNIVIQHLCVLPFPGGPSLYNEDGLWN